jgi:hypothetical protein
MYLDVIRASESPTMKHIPSCGFSKSLSTDDIALAKPNYRWAEFAGKPSAGDITGTRPKRFFAPVSDNRPVDMSLTTSDIDGAQPQPKVFRTKRCTDPLSPVYTLPSWSVVPPVIPREIVKPDILIDGSFPRPLFPPQRLRNPLDVSDIEFSRPGCRRRQFLRRGESEEAPPTRHSRCTDPLNPEYTSLSARHVVGAVDRSIPRPPLPGHSRSLDVVEGSRPARFVGCLQSGSAVDSKSAPITGARAGTRQRGLSTRRVSNPLDPVYTQLDGVRDFVY